MTIFLAGNMWGEGILSYKRGYIRVDDRLPKQEWRLRHDFKTGNFDERI